MSEQHPHSPEKVGSHEHIASAERVPMPEKTAEAYTEQQQELLETAQNAVKHEALSSKDIPIEDRKEDVPKQLFVNQELKSLSYQRIMTRTQKHLSAPARSFSKVIHQPVIDTLSKVSENTIARPSGLLAGGVCALLGSSIMLYMSKHYGFRYNLFVFIALFFAGFALGLLIELLFAATRRVRAR